MWHSTMIVLWSKSVTSCIHGQTLWLETYDARYLTDDVLPMCMLHSTKMIVLWSKSCMECAHSQADTMKRHMTRPTQSRIRILRSKSLRYCLAATATLLKKQKPRACKASAKDTAHPVAILINYTPLLFQHGGLAVSQGPVRSWNIQIVFANNVKEPKYDW